MNNQIQVFDKEWFEKNQKALLYMANAPLTKRWFRKVLRIQNDCPISEKINYIGPSWFTYGAKKEGDRITVTSDFRTHNKFSKRLYYGFLPVWNAIHLWDMEFANKVVPSLNMGFDTLTAYPQAGGGGANVTTDGYVERAPGIPESFSDIISLSGSGTSYVATNEGYIRINQAQDSPTLYNRLARSIFTFDTSSIGDTDTISAAVISLYGLASADTYDPPAEPDIDVYTSNPANNNIVTSNDYDNIGTTSQTGSPITWAGWSNSGYNDFTFSSVGIGNISKTGVSAFGVRNANYDVAGTGPVSNNFTANLRFQGYFADNTGDTNDPKLVVTYSLPSLAQAGFLYNFV